VGGAVWVWPIKLLKDKPQTASVNKIFRMGAR